MNVSGEFTVNAPRDAVYKALRDATSFVRFVDGVQDLKEIDSTHYEAVFETKVAYLRFKFNVTVEVTRAEEPSEIEAKIEGTPLGLVGRLTAKSITRLEGAGSETKVNYSVEFDARREARQHRPTSSTFQSKRHGKAIHSAAACRVRLEPMIPFEIAEPTSLAAAITLLDPDDPTIRPIAGGTALMLMMKAGVFQPTKLVTLRKIESEYSSISARADGLRIGAMTTLRALERSDEVRKHAPVITRTLRTLSNVRVRNVATVGGALAHADPHMDLPPVLIALGATLTAVGPQGERKFAVEELFSGYYETVLERNELIAEVQIPPLGSKNGVYYKVTTGSADDWPALGIAAGDRGRREGDQIGPARRQRRDR